MVFLSFISVCHDSFIIFACFSGVALFLFEEMPILSIVFLFFVLTRGKRHPFVFLNADKQADSFFFYFSFIRKSMVDNHKKQFETLGLTFNSRLATLKASSTTLPAAIRAAVEVCDSFQMVSLSTYRKK